MGRKDRDTINPLSPRMRSTATGPAPLRSASDLDWKLLKLFMVVARCESFRAAAERTGQAHNTISRKIAALEEDLGRVLITRTHDGIRLTAEGQLLLSEVERMDILLGEFARALDSTDPDEAGTVSLGVVELLGTFWLTPALRSFNSQHPRITISLDLTESDLDVMRMEADVCVQLTRPTASGAIMRRLGRVHLMPFASRKYIDINGAPDLGTDVSQHCFILLDRAAWNSDDFIPIEQRISKSALSLTRTASAAAHFWAVASGSAIGWLPSFAPQVSGDLVALEGARFSSDLWLTYHPDAGRIGRIRRTIDWLVASFDPGHFPWFRDQFVDPRGFELADP